MSGQKTINVVPDPNLTIGPYRVLTRTDGLWILYDERNPVAFMTAAIKKSKEDVVAEAKRLVDLGSPQVFVDEKTRKQRLAPKASDLVALPPPTPLGLDAGDGGDRKPGVAGFRAPTALPNGYAEHQEATSPKPPKRASRGTR